MRVSPAEYAAIDLRAHSLLADVPLHDVWAIDLPGGRDGLTILDLRKRAFREGPVATHPAVRFLFGLRARLGRIFGWDRTPADSASASFVRRLSDVERARSLVPPGTLEGSFRVLFVSPREAISEIQNATVHAFSVQVLVEVPGGHRFYWAIYVRPVGRFTSWYMHLIDPFRRFVIYPAVLRQVRAAWAGAANGG